MGKQGGDARWETAEVNLYRGANEQVLIKGIFSRGHRRAGEIEIHSF